MESHKFSTSAPLGALVLLVASDVPYRVSRVACRLNNLNNSPSVFLASDWSIFSTLFTRVDNIFSNNSPQSEKLISKKFPPHQKN